MEVRNSPQNSTVSLESYFGSYTYFVQLCSRGINTDPVCQRCCLEEEAINHVLFSCPHAQATWRCSGLPVLNIQSQNLEDNISALFDIMNDADIPSRIPKLSFWVLWYIWKSRNEFLFAQRNVHPMEDIYGASEANAEWNSVYVGKKSTMENSTKPSSWLSPPSGWLKCNFDCSFRNENGTA